MAQDRADPQPVMGVEVSGERLAQRGDLLAHLPARELGEHVRVGLAGDQRVEHVAPGLAHDVRRDGVELDAGVFERLVQPVDLARAFLDLRLAIAREVAQLADRLGRHEVGLQQPGFGELAQPRRVGDVGLAARDLLDVPRVDQHAVELVLQDRPRRLPIDAGGLHHHLRDAVAGEPVAQRQQPAHGGRELRDVLLAPAAHAGHARARGHLRLVDVQRRRALDDRLHCSPPSGRPFHDRRPGASETNESDSRARSTLRSSGETPHARLKTGSQAPRQKDRRYGRRPNHPPLFKTPEGARQRSENSKRQRRRCGRQTYAGVVEMLSGG